ncbi:hypothetical protein [Massilia sp. CF038]|uniref:hypothetical protein n=1 Tax=Massilia sp. CF038 TaxID=1881045 RepID=UPI0009248E3F|nr:hypothetical protein [Massilia sp. CF038]SHH02140.1 hypothetical protein SAMN05428948_2367 [Massilia sp. CF038]
MSPTDDHTLTAPSKKPARRSISASDFSLPKPYRRKIKSDQPRTSARFRISLLVLSIVPIAALLAALALIVHENVTTPRPLPVAAVSREEPPAVPPKKSRMATRPGAKPAASAVLAAVSDAPPTPKASGTPGKLRDPLGMPIPFQAAARHADAMPDGAHLPAPDPDVDLIASILLLTPARQLAAPCSALVDEACRELPQLEP